MFKGAGRTGPERYVDLRGRVGQALRGVSRAKGTGKTGPERGLGLRGRVEQTL